MSESLFERTSFKLDLILNTTKVELGLNSDADMYLIFKKGMRGGVSYISKKYGKANIRYLKFMTQKQTKRSYILRRK